MKLTLPFVAALALSACAQNQGEVRSYGNDMLPAGQPYGNDALPSAEVTAFQKVDARLKYADARIEYDAKGCAVYQGADSKGQMQREPLRDTANKPICVRR